jgi:RNA polymerase sigma factor (sigma-70 family)
VAERHVLRRQTEPTRRYFSRRVPNSADVEDLVQRTLLATVEALPRYREEVGFSRFVRAIASKLLLRYRRDGERARRRFDAAVQPDEVEAREPSLSACMYREATCSRLRRALGRLPGETETLLRLRYWEDRDTEEIARELGLSPGAVRKRLQRARNEAKCALAGARCSDSDVWPMEGP